MNKKTAILPVLFAFVVMGFADVSGIVTSHVKEDFELSETLAGLIPMAIFFWFLVLSAPTALMMNKIGRKTAVQVSNAITFIGMLIPLFSYNLTTCLIACAMLGIGNTIIQVALNPLLSDVVGGKGSLSSYISAGQVLKALSACAAPYLALGCAAWLGSWKYMFPAFAIITLGCYLLLYAALASEMPMTGRSALLLGLMHVLSRILSGTISLIYPKSDAEGLLRTFTLSADKKPAVAILLALLLLCAAALIWVKPVTGAAMVLAGLLTALWMKRLSAKQFGGMSGDLSGYFLQLAELIMLLCCVVTSKVVVL